MTSLLTVRQVAEYLSVDEATVRSLIHTKKLIASKFGNTYRVKPENVEACVNSCQTSGDEKDEEVA